MHLIKYWVLATRPQTLAASCAPVVIGLGFLSTLGPVSFLWSFLTLLCALVLQIGTNFTNDYVDYKKGADTDKRKGPARMVQQGHISPVSMKRASIAMFVLAFFLGILLATKGGWVIFWIGVISIACGALYTVGPIAFSYIGLGDVMACVFFGPVATCGTAYIQSGYWYLDLGILGLGVGLISTALMAVNNTRDVSEDRLSGKRTLVVRFGPRFGKWEYGLCLLGAFLILSYFVSFTALSLGILAVLGGWMGTLVWRFCTGDPAHYNTLLQLTGRTLVVYMLVYLCSVYLI